MAVLNACIALKERLERFRASLPASPSLSWEQLIQAAYAARVDLCAHGFYETPCVTLDFATGKGNPFYYYVFGAACTEVEIDTLTGDHTILRSDIVIDIGKSLNPSVDIGQIEGAFIQGYGWSVLEELVNFPNGSYYTLGPSTYKIPGIVDVPADFRVYMLRDSDNPEAIHSSKGVGEPPLCLGHSVFFAIQSAISSARAEEGIQGFFQFSIPASCEQIRLACRDAFTDPTPNAGVKGESWSTEESKLKPDVLRRLP
ncbi:xanthine dehydrogenase [Pelomyxa schiedti]|nr:xanthine dehydrogenase [Pelomyxa schiedti]